MRLLGSVGITLLLAACAWLSPNWDVPQVEVIVVNGSAEEVVFVVQEANGAVDERPVRACTAHANTFDAGRAWRLEVAGEAVAISDQVVVLDAPVTIVRLDLDPDGEVTITGPVASDRIEEGAPIRFAWAANWRWNG
jgi:phage baseplate assembly protein gpV